MDHLGDFRQPVSGYQLLLNLHHKDPGSDAATPTSYWCVIYAYHDALVIQIGIGKGKEWTGSLTDGWRELTGLLKGVFDGGVLDGAKQLTFGASVVYWAIADAGRKETAYVDEVSSLADRLTLKSTPTDIGMLWRWEVLSEEREVALQHEVSRDRWILVTPADVMQHEVNKRYSLPRRHGPANFPIVALSQHKFYFEWRQYRQAREGLEQMRRDLDQLIQDLITARTTHGEVLLSRESKEFQERLRAANRKLEDYYAAMSQVKQLGKTLQINRTNYLVNCSALMSAAEAEARVLGFQQEEAALAFVQSWRGDQIFKSVLGDMRGKYDQLSSDVAYSERVIERHIASLQSGGAQLQIDAARQLGDIGHHVAIETAAVVASLAAIVVTETLRRKTLEDIVPLPIAAQWILLVASGVFWAMLLASGHLRTWLARGSFALWTGCLTGIIGFHIHIDKIVVVKRGDQWPNLQLDGTATAVPLWQVDLGGVVIGLLLYSLFEWVYRLLRRR